MLCCGTEELSVERAGVSSVQDSLCGGGCECAAYVLRGYYETIRKAAASDFGLQVAVRTGGEGAQVQSVFAVGRIGGAHESDGCVVWTHDWSEVCGRLRRERSDACGRCGADAGAVDLTNTAHESHASERPEQILRPLRRTQNDRSGPGSDA